MSDPAPAIDFTRIRFPTDRLTIADLRRMQPDCFDTPAVPKEPGEQFQVFGHFDRRSLDGLEDHLGGPIGAEREIADRAFRKALGLEMPAGYRVDWDAEEALANDYVEMGLATGPHAAAELIRDIESQALAQARQWMGHPPP